MYLRPALLSLVAAMTLAAFADAAEKPFVVAGYLPAYRLDGWSGDVGPVTDLIFFGISLPEDGKFDASAVSAEQLRRVAEVKKRTGCRLLFTVGGWNKSSGFATMTADAQRMREFVQAASQFCREHGFDGVDYDWEHPEGQKQMQAYVQLLQHTRTVFRKDKLLVTVAQAGWQDLGKAGYAAVDRVHLMAYDQKFPQATLAKATKEVEQLIRWGCPPEKIALGLPFYGRNQAGDAKTYAQLIREGDVRGDVASGYAFNGPETIQKKIQYANTKNLAGLMIWELGQDAPGDQSLLQVIQQQLEAD